MVTDVRHAFFGTDIELAQQFALKERWVARCFEQAPNLGCNRIKAETVAAFDIKRHDFIAQFGFEQLLGPDIVILHLRTLPAFRQFHYAVRRANVIAVGSDVNLTPSDYGRFAEAAAALGIARVLVALAPFRWIARSASWRGTSCPEADAVQAASSIAVAVRRASFRMPWRSVCLHEGLAAQWMLRRRGIRSQLHYGIRTGGQRLTAHVWVGLDCRILIGEGEAESHVHVASFPATAD